MFRKSQSKYINFLKINAHGWSYFYWPRQKKKARILLALKVFIVCLGTIIISFLVLSVVFLLNLQIIYQDIQQSNNKFADIIFHIENSNDWRFDIQHIKDVKNFLQIANKQLNVLKNSKIYLFRYLFGGTNDLEEMLSQLKFVEYCLNKYIILKSQKVDLIKYENREIALKKFYANLRELDNIQKQIDWLTSDSQKDSVLSLNYFYYGLNKNLLFNLQKKIQLEIKQSKFLITLLGYPKSLTYLLVFTDSHHLRGSGGQIKIIGTLEISRGKIGKLKLFKVSELDKYASQKIKIPPPLALKKYAHINNWLLSDANWSPDWPTAAKRIEWLYYKEKNFLPNVDLNNLDNNIDGVILITDNFLARFLRIVNDDFSLEKNWLETNSLLNSPYATTSLSIFVNTINKQLGNLDKNRQAEFLDNLRQGILNKEVVCYFKNVELEEMIKEYKLDGILKRSNDDYLLVVDYNLNGDDYMIPRQINYYLEEKEEGWYAKLAINYSNQSLFSEKTEDYISYTRIYLPSNIKIATSSGFNKIDVNNEFNKTVIGTFLKVPAGGMHNLYLEYQLPFNDNISHNYIIYTQKQIGNNYSELNIDLKTLNNIQLYSPTGFNAKRLNANYVKWEDNFVGDKIFEIRK